jgi:hypothetical protein
LKDIGIVLEALEGVSECMTDGEPAKQPKAISSALAAWSKRKTALLATLHSEDQIKLQEAFTVLRSNSGIRAAEAALDASELLASHLPKDRNANLGAADRACMRAWVHVEAARWDAVPNLQAAFKTFLDQDAKKYGLVLQKVQTALASFQTGLSAHDAIVTKKAAAELLELVDALEKPAQ